MADAPHVDNLRQTAKRWLKALRASDPEAALRFRAAYPGAPAVPNLRAVQHALALERGHENWQSLKAAAEQRDARERATAASVEPSTEQVSWFIHNACPDHHVRGGPAHVSAIHTATRLLAQYPEIAHASFYTSIVCGDLASVERVLAERPEAVNQKGGPKGWEPLLYLCFTRLLLPDVSDHPVAIARALLDRGADPRVYFMAGDSKYTPFVGVVGEGEEDRPGHSRRDALARMLLERGAEPFDIQVNYNIGFRGNVLWFLELIYDQSITVGRKAAWDDPEWSMLDMGGYGSGARWLFEIAVRKNDLALARWMLEHGANPNAAPPRAPRLSKRSLYEEAMREGLTDMADLLVRFGATPTSIVFEGEERFTAACFRLDRSEARALLATHPEYLQSTKTIFAAAERDRADVVALLLDLGLSPDVADERKQRALHIAAYRNSLRVAELLIARGAEIDPVESNWDNTPIGGAVYCQHAAMIDLLGRVSRDISELVYVGNVERVSEVLRADPDRARVVSQSNTLLMWLPDDDEKAMAMVELLLAGGADPSLRNEKGMTAADIAEKRGMFAIANRLRAESARVARPTVRNFEQIADDLLAAYRTGEERVMQSVWKHFGHRRAADAMRTYVALDLGKRPAAENERVEISLDDARLLVAREHGFENWRALVDEVGRQPAEKAIAAKPVKLVSVDPDGGEREEMRTRDWDAVIALMTERGIGGLNAEGQMTDALLDRVARLEHVTSLNLNGSPLLTDAGLVSLARLSRLQHLQLACRQITDRGVDVLRNLPDLRTVSLSWSGVTDAGAANLAHCQRLKRVDLSGTRSGDGAIRALSDTDTLRDFRSGQGVTDAGLALLHRIPAFKTWQGGEVSMALLGFDAKPTYLLLRGSFTDRGLATLVGLNGLFALNVGFAPLAITAAGLAPLVDLPHLGWLAFDATDDAMPYIAALPHLRFLMCQDTSAGDDGFEALSRSRTIECIWGRRCYNLRGRGFRALGNMPSLRALSVSCKNVEDEALAALPAFPALTELMPMDVPDAGYRHIGRCDRLESLVLMYCRETGDVATEHIARLPRLKKYFASYTRITDRSLEILGSMPSLEEITLSGCAGVTDAGVQWLASLPRLRDLDLSGMPNVTNQSVALFPPHVRVKHSLA